MECPYCYQPVTSVTNSRASKSNSQIWRRRKCLNCKALFTTHEIIDLSHIAVVKKSGEAEMFSRMKLYSGIFYASMASKIPKRELVIDSITRAIEKDILGTKKKRITSGEIAEIVLHNLKHKHTPTFLRFLTFYNDIKSTHQLKQVLEKYL